MTTQQFAQVDYLRRRRDAILAQQAETPSGQKAIEDAAKDVEKLIDDVRFGRKH